MSRKAEAEEVWDCYYFLFSFMPSNYKLSLGISYPQKAQAFARHFSVSLVSLALVSARLPEAMSQKSLLGPMGMSRRLLLYPSFESGKDGSMSDDLEPPYVSVDSSYGYNVVQVQHICPSSSDL